MGRNDENHVPARNAKSLGLSRSGAARHGGQHSRDGRAPHRIRRRHRQSPSAIRQTEFSIPFRLTPPADPTQQPAEVQLHSSADHGVSWQIASRVKPTAGRFVFRAPHDGDYWFCIRTVDRQGVTHPDGLQKAELQVIVDTLPPRLDLTATRGSAGEITGRAGRSSIRILKPDSLTIEYQPAPESTFGSALAIEPRHGRAHCAITLSGETTWWPKAGRRSPITVRAAGNRSRGQPGRQPGESHDRGGGQRCCPDAAGRPDPGATKARPPAQQGLQGLDRCRRSQAPMLATSRRARESIGRPTAPPTTNHCQGAEPVLACRRQRADPFLAKSPPTSARLASVLATRYAACRKERRRELRRSRRATRHGDKRPAS